MSESADAGFATREDEVIEPVVPVSASEAVHQECVRSNGCSISFGDEIIRVCGLGEIVASEEEFGVETDGEREDVTLGDGSSAEISLETKQDDDQYVNAEMRARQRRTSRTPRWF